MRAGRARVGIVLLAAFALASLSSPLFASPAEASPYTPIYGESQPDVSSPSQQVTEATFRLGQSFRSTINFTLTRIALYVQDRGNDNDLTVTVVPDSAGLPLDTTILASGQNNSAGTYEWSDYTLTPTLTVTTGTTYWIVGDGQGGAGNGYAWRYSSADLFSRGTAASASGATWTAIPGDFSFILSGWSPPSMALSVTADRASIASGEVVEYAIRVANAGTEDASDVWVNASIDPRLTFRDATGSGTISISGGDVTFHLSALANGTTWFFVNATAGALLEDGAFTVFPVTVDFFDGVGRQSALGDAPVEIWAPRFAATIVLTEGSRAPGDIVTFGVAVTNEGRASAGHLWVNETLHSALTYLSDTSPVAPEQEGDRESWHFLDTGAGQTIRFNVTVQVDPSAVHATVIANFVSVEYTDPLGAGLVRSRSNAISFYVTGVAGTNPWLWGSFAISATIVGGSYAGYAGRRLRTEEIFLIHHSGVLLVHMSKTMKADHDTDILSGMFTAILNFVRDSFHYEARQELHGLDLGRYRVHVRKGAITYLALVHTGKPRRWLARAAARAVRDLEAQYGEMLREWDGEVRALAGIRDLLKGYFLSPTGPSQSWSAFRRSLARLDQTFKPMRPL